MIAQESINLSLIVWMIGWCVIVHIHEYAICDLEKMYYTFVVKYAYFLYNIRSGLPHVF